MTYLRLIIYIFSILTLNTPAFSFPTLEGLLRNNSNPDHEKNFFHVSVQLMEDKEDSNEVLLFFENQSKQPAVLIKRDLEGKEVSKNEIARILKEDIPGVSFPDVALTAFFHSLLFNSERYAMAFLRSNCGAIIPQSTMVDEEKQKILDELKGMLKKESLKEEQIWKNLNNGDIQETQKILNRPLYISDQNIKLELENGEFYYAFRQEGCVLKFQQNGFELDSLEIDSQEAPLSIKFKDYVSFSGTFYFPSRIILQSGSSTKVYKIRSVLGSGKPQIQIGKGVMDHNKIFP